MKIMIVDQLMSSHILPMVPHLLRDDDPMPLYALKVRHPIKRIKNTEKNH